MSKLTKIDKQVTIFRHYAKPVSVKVADIARKVEMTPNDQVWVGSLTALLESGEKLCKSVTSNLNEHMGKLPPQDPSLESNVLGVVILFTDTPADKRLYQGPAIDQVKDFLKAEHFALESHRIVYGAILKLRQADRPFGMMELVHELRSTGNIDTIGGAAYVAELTRQVTRPADIAYDARILIEMAMRREGILMLAKAVQAFYDDTQDVFETIDFAEEQIKNIKSWIK